MLEEQRECIRLLPKSNAFAALGCGITLVGKICDISKSGLAFEHIANIDLKQDEPKAIDIFIAGGDFYLPDIRCIGVYDIPLNPEYNLNSFFIQKRCGVKFAVLTDEQLKELEHFLKNHTSAVI